MPNPQPFPGGGISLLFGSTDYGKPTKDWIGEPSMEDIELFLWFMLGQENIATRKLASSGHQTEQMRGDFCAYAVRAPRIRGSDLTRRIYVCVRVVELVGESNWEACRRVASYLEDLLGRTNRGRKPKASSPHDFLNKVNTVRGLYNRAKVCHRWKEQLPERDLELENSWRTFLLFKEWAHVEHALAVVECQRRAISIEDFCTEIQEAGKPRPSIAVIRKIEQMRTKRVSTHG